MASTLTGIAFNANIQASITPNVATLSGNVYVSDQTNMVITPGSAVGSADGVFTVNGSVVSGTPAVINLEALTDPFGNTLTAAHVVAVKITNTSAPTAGTLAHGGGTEPLYGTQPLTISGGDFFAQSFNGAGLPITSGTAQNITLTASTGTVTYKATVLVRSV